MMYALRSYFDSADVGLEPGTYQLYIADQSQFVTQALHSLTKAGGLTSLSHNTR